MASYSETVDDGIGFHPSYPAPTGYGVTVVDSPGLDDAFGSFTQGTVLQDSTGFHEVQFFYAYQAGAALVDGVAFDDAVDDMVMFTQTVDDALIWMDDNITVGRGLTLTEGVGFHLAQTLARAVTVLDKLGVHEVLSSNSASNLYLFDGLGFDDNIVDFFGLGGVQGVAFGDTLQVTAQFNRVTTDGIGFHPSLLANTLFMRVVDDNIGLDDETLVQGIYTSSLDDTMQFSIATVDPGGGFTTWAINTRTSAVTEYQNYVFNSFAQIGNQFYGASDDGLYLLNNETDNGVNIGTDIKGALLALGGSRFTQLDGVYLGIRVNDNAREFILKLITPGGPGNSDTDKTFIYSFKANNMKTTRVTIGKGLRTRYLQWELITNGADYDLDSIEFVPLIAKRRV